jgi:hypothetical protein
VSLLFLGFSSQSRATRRMSNLPFTTVIANGDLRIG